MGMHPSQLGNILLVNLARKVQISRERAIVRTAEMAVFLSGMNQCEDITHGQFILYGQDAGWN